MGKVVVAKTVLRYWGSQKPLDVKGMFTTELVTRRGARKKTQSGSPLARDQRYRCRGLRIFHLQEG